MYRIMIVDDQRSITYLWSRAFQKFDYEVVVAHNNYEAIKLLKEKPLPDLMMVDHVLSDGLGLAIIAKLEELDPEHNTKVFLITADPVEFISEIPERVDEFLQKPVLLRTLLELIARYSQSATN